MSHLPAEPASGTRSGPAIRLSVVIPVYNGAATIGGLLDALLAQSDARCEIIAIDDCSTDGSAAVLALYAGRGVVCLRTARNSGAATARNLGAAAARGHTLLFFDSDDVPSPVLLPTVRAALERHPAATFGGYLLAEQPLHAVDTSVLKRYMTAVPAPARVFAPHAYAWQLAAGRRLVTASSAFVRKSLFDAHGGFKTGMRAFDDPELFARLSAGTPFLRIPEVLGIYRIPETPPARRTQPGAANECIATLRGLALRHGRRYRLIATLFALRMALVARAAGADARACLTSLKETGAGLGARLLGALLVYGASPALLRQVLRLYRRVRRRRALEQLRHVHAPTTTNPKETP